LEQQTTVARQDWRISSSSLARVLRLNPSALVVPLEPPHLKVTIVSPGESLDQLIPEGLANRPELASREAVVRASMERLKQEKMRPYIPTVVVQPSANPGNTLGAGFYGAGLAGEDPTWSGRSDWDFQLLWQLQNLGAGNVALVNERQGEQQQANVQLLRMQDAVSSDVVQAHARLLAASTRVAQAQVGLVAAKGSFDGNLKGLGETIRTGNQLQLTIRPQEVTAALRQLLQAYINYYSSVNDYNREQFRLYHAIGYPAQSLADNQAWGEPQPCDGLASRPDDIPVRR
jgi:outer membrane protein TolC